MGVTSVQKVSASHLILVRKSDFSTKAAFVALVSCVAGLIFFASETFLCKLVLIICAGVIGFITLDNEYEVFEFNSVANELRVTNLHWCRYLVDWKPAPYVQTTLEDISDVHIDEIGSETSKTTYQVVLSLTDDTELELTSKFPADDFKKNEALANLILSFLGRTAPVMVYADTDSDG